MARPRSPVMDYMLKSNLSLLTVRNPRKGNTDSFFLSELITDKDGVSPFDNARVYPLYFYPENQEETSEGADKDVDTESPKIKQPMLGDMTEQADVWQLSEKGRRPNLNPEFIAEMEAKLGLTFITEGKGTVGTAFLPSGASQKTDRQKPVPTFGPEDVFHYAYAVFHSPTYRERYAEFLKIDFPRLPLTSDVALFKTLCEKGESLVKWHLMTHPEISKTTVTFDIEGSAEVLAGHPRYDEKEERVYINREQYFSNVPEAVWNFHIGGYQVLAKWLKDRKGRKLEFQDVRHYQRIVKALQETMSLMDAIDEALPGFPIT